jgi:hypothetical protein
MASVRTYVPSMAAIISSSWATSMRFDLPERGEGGGVREVEREMGRREREGGSGEGGREEGMEEERRGGRKENEGRW